MLAQRLEELERRLSDAERELATARLHLSELQRPKRSQLAQLAGLIVVGGAVLALLAPPMAVQAQLPGKTHAVEAPFTIVDRAGQTIFRVDENNEGYRGARVLNAAGTTLIRMGVSDGDGLVQTSNSGKSTEATMGGDDYGLAIKNGKVLFQDANGKPKLEMKDSGLKVNDSNGAAIIRVAADPAGEFGSVVIGKAGRTYAAMRIDSDVGKIYTMMGETEGATLRGDSVVAYNAKGNAVVSMKPSPSGNGAGYFAVGDPGGSAIVEAGMLKDGNGVVRAYPLTGKTPIPIPNFLRGGKSFDSVGP